MFLQGVLTCATLIVAIGSQNAFVLKNALHQNHVFAICLLCFVCDFVLMGVGILGLGSILTAHQGIAIILAMLGALFLFTYGALSFKNALTLNHALTVDGKAGKTTLKAALLGTLAVTLLNPHVYLDTVVIIGGIAGTMTLQQKWQFLAGALLVSFVWFFGLGYGARFLLPIFAKPKAWKILDTVIGIVMWWIGFGLIKFVYRAFVGD